MRLGIYGGAFDPPHNAHLALARAAVGQLRLDGLRIFPTGQAWHREEPLTPPKHRLAMARLAFDPVPKAVVDDREIRRPGPTYTIDTLRELRREQPDAQLFLVVGEDQARAFTRWHEWEEIVRLATLCVAYRASAASAPTDSPSAHPGLEGLPTLTLQLPEMPESATEIRARVQRGEDISSLVPAAVASYIASHHLYRSH